MGASNHCLHQLLPPIKSIPMQLRDSQCLYELPVCHYNLHKRSFVLRNLFLSAYWLFIDLLCFIVLLTHCSFFLQLCDGVCPSLIKLHRIVASSLIYRSVPFSMTMTNISRQRQYSTLNIALTVCLQDRHIHIHTYVLYTRDIFRPTMDNYSKKLHTLCTNRPECYFEWPWTILSDLQIFSS